MRSHVLFGFVLMSSLTTMVMSQVTPCDTICDTTYTTRTVYEDSIATRLVNYFKIPVTYYDYHVDGSNPDFGERVTSRWEMSDQSYANISGWVDSSLTSDTKLPQRNPALTDPFLDISWNIEKLFTPSTEGVVDSFLMKFPPIIKDTVVDTLIVRIVDTLYDADSTMTIQYDTLRTITIYDTIPVPDTMMISDTMFKNIEIADSITAYWLPNEFTEDSTDSMWMFGQYGSNKMDPLNGRGFGEENDSTYNAGYTFRLHNKFTYTKGDVIYFGGDDDIYLFIDGRLAIECGGFHEAIPVILPLDSFYLPDSVPLTAGQQYDLDIFFVERRQGGNFFIGGLSEFENKGAIQIETMYDTLQISHIDTTHTKVLCTINCTGINSPLQKVHQQKLLGLNIPSASKYVTLEYFSISGAKVLNRKMPIAEALATTPVALPWGMYLIRVNFLDADGKHLLKPSFRKMIVKK